MAGARSDGPSEGEQRPAASRPRPVVPARDKRFLGRTVADVHGRRDDVPLLAPEPGLLALCEHITPAVYIDLGRPCNSACLYCAVPPHEDAQGFLPSDQVQAIAAAGRAAGCDRAILVGGEPTIHPELDAVLRACADAGLDGGQLVMTNGLRLARPGFAAWLADRGVRTVHFSLDTVDEATYARLARSSSGQRAQLDGFTAALGEPRLWTYVYTAVTKLNAPHLPALAHHLAERAAAAGRPPPVWVLALCKPLGDGLRHADELLISPQESVPLVAQTVALGRSLGLSVGVRNLQACLAPELVHHLVDYYLDDFSVELVSGVRRRFSHHEYWRKPSERCGRCGHQALCTGIYGAIAERFGVEAFAPIGGEGLRDAAAGLEAR